MLLFYNKTFLYLHAIFKIKFKDGYCCLKYAYSTVPTLILTIHANWNVEFVESKTGEGFPSSQ